MTQKSLIHEPNSGDMQMYGGLDNSDILTYDNCFRIDQLPQVSTGDYSFDKIQFDGHMKNRNSKALQHEQNGGANIFSTVNMIKIENQFCPERNGL